MCRPLRTPADHEVGRPALSRGAHRPASLVRDPERDPAAQRRRRGLGEQHAAEDQRPADQLDRPERSPKRSAASVIVHSGSMVEMSDAWAAPTRCAPA